ncbi:DNA replication and repair protein RecN [Dongia mobilis]|uniref:DNA repair protein RecN n=1 Tax=Dongia mobilis TaxID=578943 RepID=A0A4R6WQV0_9PROT|nr:DNA repair protein RecN [Dongia mobilis]TDQ83972.1 DNA replication and repair protein RecN [Dongia mobilis]
MLVGLSIHNVVLIERLELAFAPGLTVLTGETGAGKSILLDALGLALGARAESGLVRKGAAQAMVAAAFQLAQDHAVQRLLEEQGIAAEDNLILRRQVGSDGRSRAFVNDQPVSVAFLKTLGEHLIEIEGQFETHGLLDPANHRDLLDGFGGHRALLEATAAAHRAWRAAEDALAEAEAALAQARSDEEYLRHAVAELELIAPQPEEEARLAQERQVLMAGAQVIEAIGAAHQDLAGDRGADRTLIAAERRLQRVADRLGDALGSELAAIAGCLDRAGVELREAIAGLQSLQQALDADPARLERVEERLHALRDLARKHRIRADDLPAHLAELTARLQLIDGRSGDLAALQKQAAETRGAYVRAALALTEARGKAARALDQAVARELAPLKLDKARFVTRIQPLPEMQWGEAGQERAAFEVATNPGAEPGPIQRIASGGELARFMLALKVSLARAQPVPTLVFDEVDAGIGGATAAAVGERLKRLAGQVQVLVITHSPQVAALGAQHWRVEKKVAKGATSTSVATLSAEARREEIARMLSGATISDEARAAADKLLKGAA